MPVICSIRWKAPIALFLQFNIYSKLVFQLCKYGCTFLVKFHRGQIGIQVEDGHGG